MRIHAWEACHRNKAVCYQKNMIAMAQSVGKDRISDLKVFWGGLHGKISWIPAFRSWW